MFTSNKKDRIAKILSAILVIGILIPGSLLARPFLNDSEIVVYPNNEVISFSETRVGNTSTAYLTIENNSNSDRSLQISDLPSSPFSYPSSTRFTIQSESSRSFAVNFSPNRSGYFESTFDLTNLETGEVKVIRLQAVATDTNSNGGVTVSRNSIQFPNTLIEENSISTLTVTNNNSTDVTISANISSNSLFNLLSTTRSQTLRPDQSYTYEIEFSPTRTGIFTENLNISASGNNLSRTFRVAMTATAGESNRPQYTELSILGGSQIDFGTIETNKSETETIILKNTGTKDIKINLTNNGDDPFEADLGANNKKYITLDPNQEGTLRVKFKPEHPGDYQTTVTINTDQEHNSRKSFTVFGSAVASRSYESNLKIDASINSTTINSRNRELKISYETSVDANTTVTILRGDRVVKTLKNTFTEGDTKYSAYWNATDENSRLVADGNYTYLVSSRSISDRVIKEKTGTIKVDFEKDTTDEYGIPDLRVSRSVINPDFNEVAYFNLYLPNSASTKLTIKNPRTGQTVYSKTTSLQTGDNSYDISWNGRNSSKSKVSEGKYSYTLTVSSSGKNATFNGNIIVERSENYRETDDHQVYIKPESRYEREYNYRMPLINNENLINKISANPPIMSGYGTEIKVSFELEYTTPITVNILDSNKNLVKTVTKNRVMHAGYKKNLIEWDTMIGGLPVRNGEYLIEVTTTRMGETDTDLTKVLIDRTPGTNFVPEKDLIGNYVDAPALKIYEEYFDEAPMVMNQKSKICLNFIDIEADSEFCDAVILATELELIRGGKVEDDFRVLRPDDYLTRAEATAVIVRILDLDLLKYNADKDGNFGYKDLDSKMWYMSHIKTMVKTALKQNVPESSWIKSVIKPYKDSTYKPNQTIIRSQLYKQLFEALSTTNKFDTNFVINYDVTKAPFVDTLINQSTNWFLPYAELVKNELNDTDFAAKYFGDYNLKSKQAKFNATEGVTRGELIELIYQLHSLKLIEINE